MSGQGKRMSGPLACPLYVDSSHGVAQNLTEQYPYRRTTPMTTLFIILLIACAAGFWVAATTLLFFLYESRNSGYAETLAGLGYSSSAIIRRILGFGFLSEIGIYLQTLTTPVTGWIWSPKRRGNSDEDNGDVPVLLVHGLYGNASNWLAFRWKLKRSGVRHVYAYSYNSFGPDYFALLEKLDRMVDATRARHGGRPVFLVGHSLGGLLIRGYASSGMAVENGECKIAGATTIGAPLEGSKLAALAVGRLGRSIIYRSELIQELEKRDVAPPFPCLAIYSPIDNFVLPNSSMDPKMPGWRKEHSPAVTHVCMLFSRPVMRRVAKFFKECVKSV
ncbi:hypothetical protein DQK91_06400 [Oceanidesulfovibrio marinus]|uniref:AB hydrolase-1 domain-containing protein n=2 Tax=Oceanidesulfovibrio marinus TaxID=370038 RepID=A0A6P1ZLU9_9BACT|nr:hypothetical protein DQK91_06400 [Oceanidesulfovibrio marinus]